MKKLIFALLLSISFVPSIARADTDAVQAATNDGDDLVIRSYNSYTMLPKTWMQLITSNPPSANLSPDILINSMPLMTHLNGKQPLNAKLTEYGALGNTNNSILFRDASGVLINKSLSSFVQDVLSASSADQMKASMFTGSTSQVVLGDGTLGAYASAPMVFIKPTYASATTAAQLSATRDADVSYEFDATVSISVLTGQAVTATLAYADNVSMTTNPVVVSSQTASNSGVLGLTQSNTLKLAGYIPAGKYRRVTFVVAGGATAPSTLKAGQEVLL